MIRTYTHRFFFSCILLLSLSMTACGFHLRKPQQLAPELSVVYIQTSTPNDPFIQVLSRLLLANGVQLTSASSFASSTLRILSIQQNNNLSALQGAAEAGQYLTSLTVSFSVADSSGHVLLAPTSVTRSATYSNNATQVLSANSMANQLTIQLQQQLAQAILQQLASIHSAQTNSHS
ncbi:MAG: lptE [Gammaproteobacteria bacterium]|jgi:LPS-assembly lipoprotein|nr:lptE [Gammaproteobacteria bacterium]